MVTKSIQLFFLIALPVVTLNGMKQITEGLKELTLVRKPLTHIPEYLLSYAHPLKKVGLRSGGQIQDLFVFDDSEIELKNYRLTLKYIQNTVLAMPISSMNFQEFITLIHTLNSKLQGSNKNKDAFRKEMQFVDTSEVGCAFSSENFKTYLEENRASDVPVYSKIMSVLSKPGLCLTALRAFEEYVNSQGWSEKEWKLFKEFTYIAPDFDHIENQLQEAFNKFKKLCEEKANPFTVAAYMHQELVRIHPYIEANGRLARLIMNIILMQAGYEPLVFTANKEYTLHVKQGITTISLFENYIKEQHAEIEQKKTKNVTILPSNICSKQQYIDFITMILKK